MSIAAPRQELEAIYQGGVFRPLSAPALADGARVHLLVETEAPPADPLELAGQVYDGLTAHEVADIEVLILDRSTFFGDRSSS